MQESVLYLHFAIVILQYFTTAQSQHRANVKCKPFTPFKNEVRFTISFPHKLSIIDENDIMEGLH